jgi:hypothetical protein
MYEILFFFKILLEIKYQICFYSSPIKMDMITLKYECQCFIEQ